MFLKGDGLTYLKARYSTNAGVCFTGSEVDLYIFANESSLNLCNLPQHEDYLDFFLGIFYT